MEHIVSGLRPARFEITDIKVSSYPPVGEEIVKSAVRFLPAMPIEVIYVALNVAVSCETDADEIVYKFRDSKKPRGFIEVNPYALRTNFLDIKTPPEAFAFLSQTGNFRGARNRRSREQLTWNEFRNWQEVIRLLLQYGEVPEHLESSLKDVSPEESRWLRGTPSKLSIFTSGADKPGSRGVLQAEIRADTTVEAILATAYVDDLRGVEYQLCALPGCDKLYEVTSKHKRQYCCQKHAHRASIEKRREDNRKNAIKKK
jgi:hypothetical protein